mgnify:CR=1 FL=1
MIRINPAVSYREKNGTYVFYYDFNYLFFSDTAAHLISKLLRLLSKKKTLVSLPGPFIEYLKMKKIIEEKK